ncbi:MAG TPA: response regulator [bacterium]|nr:response regulator [bacterium]
MHRAKRILIIDDEEAVRTVLAKFMSREGFEHDCASSGDEAIWLLETNEYDFVITDLVMPGAHGLELLERIKSMNSEVPVAIMTGFGTSDRTIEALRGGAVDFIEKPLDFDRISQLLSKVFKRRRREAGYAEALAMLASGTFVLPNDAIILESAARIATKRLEGTRFHDGVYLALIECLTNAMEHGNLEIGQEEKIDAISAGALDELKRSRLADPVLGNREVFLTMKATDDSLRFTVRDEGKGFDYRNLPDPTEAENLFNASGRGVLLVQCYMDEVSWNHAGNEITILKSLNKLHST